MTRRLFVAAAAVLAIAGCSIDKQTAPELTGPSELGLSLSIAASPDAITQDGQSVATITILARDASSGPVSGLTLRVQTWVNGAEVDHGVLSSKVVSTNTDGRAVVTYRAPAQPPPTVTADTVVTVSVTPVGNQPCPSPTSFCDYGAQTPRYVDIRLTRPGIIVDPGGAPRASFVYSPTTPRSEDYVFFDASASTGRIVRYEWNFGDGDDETTTGPTVRHRYELPGTYKVLLTVVDDLDRRHTAAEQTLTVTALLDPVADFTFSPTGPARGEVINFNASLSKAQVGHSIVRYTWDFGDGSPIVSGGGPTVQKAYGAATTYTVVLQVQDSAGRTGTKAATITVKP